MNVLVTGATGLIGAHLTRELIAGGHSVWAVTRGAVPDASTPNLHWCPLDLVSFSDQALPRRADVVVHLAQSAHYRSFPDGAMDVFDVNVASTARLLDWSRRAGVRQFILASSGGVSSQAAEQPLSYYAASKRCAELLAGAYGGTFELLTLRFFFVYGAAQKPWMLVPRLVQTIGSDAAVMLAGHDGTRLNPIYVGDAACAVARAIDVGASGVIDIAGPEVLSIRAMSEVIAARLARTARFACDEDAVAHDLIGDISVMSSQLIAPRRRFSDGIAEMLAAAGGHAS